MIVDGKTIPFSSNSTVNYTSEDNQIGSLYNTVQVTAVDVSQARETDALKIEMTSSVEKGVKRALTTECQSLRSFSFLFLIHSRNVSRQLLSSPTVISIRAVFSTYIMAACRFTVLFFTAADDSFWF